MSLLKVEDMHVYYGNIHAIKGVSFEVNEGEMCIRDSCLAALEAAYSCFWNIYANAMRNTAAASPFCRKKPQRRYVKLDSICT